MGEYYASPARSAFSTPPIFIVWATKRILIFIYRIVGSLLSIFFSVIILNLKIGFFIFISK